MPRLPQFLPPLTISSALSIIAAANQLPNGLQQV
jgi:hypothetical protein